MALIDWRERSIRALETTLGWLVHFLAPSATLVVWLDGKEKATGRMLQAILDKWNFVVEAGTRTSGGRGVSACRRDACTHAFSRLTGSGSEAANYAGLAGLGSGDEIRSKSQFATLRMFLRPDLEPKLGRWLGP